MIEVLVTYFVPDMLEKYGNYMSSSQEILPQHLFLIGDNKIQHLFLIGDNKILNNKLFVPAQ